MEGPDSFPHLSSPPLLNLPPCHYCVLEIPMCPPNMLLYFNVVTLSWYVCYLQPKSLNTQMFTNICRLLELKGTFSLFLCLRIQAWRCREFRRLTPGNAEPEAEPGSAPRTSWLPRVELCLPHLAASKSFFFLQL